MIMIILFYLAIGFSFKSYIIYLFIHLFELCSLLHFIMSSSFSYLHF